MDIDPAALAAPIPPMLVRKLVEKGVNRASPRAAAPSLRRSGLLVKRPGRHEVEMSRRQARKFEERMSL